jgi:uncharacterized protein (DUF2267 family)
MTTLSFYRRVSDKTGQADREAVKRGTAAVLQALRDRLLSTEAPEAAAQLHRKAFYERVQREVGLKTVREARFLTIAVFAALKEQLSSGEADDVLAELPRDLKDVWEDA